MGAPEGVDRKGRGKGLCAPAALVTGAMENGLPYSLPRGASPESTMEISICPPAGRHWDNPMGVHIWAGELECCQQQCSLWRTFCRGAKSTIVPPQG